MAIIDTPTSANTACHLVANPNTPNPNITNFNQIAKTIF